MTQPINGKHPIDIPEQQTSVQKVAPRQDSQLVGVIKDYERFRDEFLVKDCTFIGGEPPLRYEEVIGPDGKPTVKVVTFQMEGRYCFDRASFPHVTPDQLRKAIKLAENPDASADSVIDDICAHLVDIQLETFKEAAPAPAVTK